MGMKLELGAGPKMGGEFLRYSRILMIIEKLWV